MTPDATTPNTPSPNTAQGEARLAAKRRHKPIERFPLRFHYAITPAMGDALKRLTGNNSLKAEADVGRDALHYYLLQVDQIYARTFQGGNRNA
jgi:hypothetical protein